MIDHPDDAGYSAMNRFFRGRGCSLATVIVASIIISMAQGGLSYSSLLGALRDGFNLNTRLLASLHWPIRAGLLVLAGTLRTSRRQRAVYRVIIVASAFFTAILLRDVAFFLSVLSGSNPSAAEMLLFEVALIAVSNILVFSIWYWILDPPGVIETADAGQPWAFLFPQRGSVLPKHESWAPRYVDDRFLAFMTSFALSPTDTLPLTRTAKMPLMAHATISVVTLTGIAGAAINILAGEG